jgi:hypothetical protein
MKHALTVNAGRDAAALTDLARKRTAAKRAAVFTRDTNAAETKMAIGTTANVRQNLHGARAAGVCLTVAVNETATAAAPPNALMVNATNAQMTRIRTNSASPYLLVARPVQIIATLTNSFVNASPVLTILIALVGSVMQTAAVRKSAKKIRTAPAVVSALRVNVRSANRTAIA